MREYRPLLFRPARRAVPYKKHKRTQKAERGTSLVTFKCTVIHTGWKLADAPRGTPTASLYTRENLGHSLLPGADVCKPVVSARHASVYSSTFIVLKASGSKRSSFIWVGKPARASFSAPSGTGTTIS